MRNTGGAPKRSVTTVSSPSFGAFSDRIPRHDKFVDPKPRCQLTPYVGDTYTYESDVRHTIGQKLVSETHTPDALVDLLKDCTKTDFGADNAWTSAPRILAETRSRREHHWLRNETHDGALLFTIDGLFVYNAVQSYYTYVEHLPVDEAAKEHVRAGNVLDLVE